jgi:hypothetical protein
MRSVLRPVPVWALLATAQGFLVGCAPRVRQDRSINWSPEGHAVGFQHDEAGVSIPEEPQERAPVLQRQIGEQRKVLATAVRLRERPPRRLHVERRSACSRW